MWTTLRWQRSQDLNSNELRHALNEAGKAFGMKTNVKKTKTMIIGKKAIVPRVNIELDGQVLEQVSCFTYLGQTITEDGKCDEEIKRRIGQARSAFNTMRDVLCCWRLPLSSRLRLLKCYVWSTLLYGVETWTVSKTSEKRLNAFEMWSLRRMMHVSWTRRLSNENILKLAGVFRVVQNRKLLFWSYDAARKHPKKPDRRHGTREERTRKTKKSVVSQRNGLDGKRRWQRSLKTAST